MNEITLPTGRKIGHGHPVYIIAEVGSNWRTLEDCMTSISQAKACGADAVKFQLFTSESLYGLNVWEGRMGTQPFAPLKLQGELPPEWIPKLAEKCRAVGIDFMCTAFSPDLYDVVNPCVDMHKVASAEATHVRILEKLRSYGKPVILSAGAKTVGDISQALEVIGDTPTALLYCVAAYPARSLNMTHIPLLRETFKKLVGYSDHSTDSVTIPAAAVDAGACVIEKHVNFVGHDGPDAPHSLGPDEFKNMVSCLRTGQESINLQAIEERPMVLRHNRRLIATREIPAGSRFIEGENMGIYRSLKDDTRAFSPFAINQVNGRTAKGLIRAGDGIGPADIE